MRFGKNAAEAAEEPGRGGAGGQFMRYLKDGDQTMRILQEPDEWTYFWEHFSPAGFSFPCPRAADDPVDMCPGCSTDNEKMKKVNRRIAFNILHSFNGQEYVDVLKVGSTVADKLENRYKRFGTVTDRDYTITRYKTSGDRYDFDVEGNTPVKIDLRKEDWKDPEEMLQRAWDDAWGDPNQAAANKQATEAAPVEQKVTRPTIAATPKVQSADPPSEPQEEKTFQEADLRAMDRDLLINLIQEDMHMSPPSTLKTSDAIVDWLMELQA